jgi:hypothetical protein
MRLVNREKAASDSIESPLYGSARTGKAWLLAR